MARFENEISLSDCLQYSSQTDHDDIYDATLKAHPRVRMQEAWENITDFPSQNLLFDEINVLDNAMLLESSRAVCCHCAV